MKEIKLYALSATGAGGPGPEPVTIVTGLGIQPAMLSENEKALQLGYDWSRHEQLTNRN